VLLGVACICGVHCWQQSRGRFLNSKDLPPSGGPETTLIVTDIQVSLGLGTHPHHREVWWLCE
jgi:hypothetical protein